MLREAGDKDRRASVRRHGNYRKGQIGGWREHFDKSHLLAAKPLLGEALIRLNYKDNLDAAKIGPSPRQPWSATSVLDPQEAGHLG